MSLNLTEKQKKRAAKEARKLAMEIVVGEAPPIDPLSYATCACGWVAARTQIRDAFGHPHGRAVEEAAFGKDSLFIGRALVSDGLELHGPLGAVFPLLAMADLLEGK